MKTLTLISTGLERSDRHKEATDEYTRESLFETTLHADILDEHFLQTVPLARRLFYKLLPPSIAQVLEAYWIRRHYDVVITWAEKLGLSFALLLKLTGSRTPHITLNSWISKPKKAIALKWLHSHIDRIILWSSVQREFALNVLKIPASKIAFTRWLVDQQFWRPIETDTDMICAVGTEMRDYPTFIEAMRGLDIRCHIAAGETRGKLFSTVKAITDCGPLPGHITVGKLSYVELRALYARSRFVVVPLLETDTDNGITCILEAMAMGKAVICSRTRGQVDVIQEGETGIFVPQGDPIALREAIQFLWARPDVAEQMGKAGRRYIEAHHTLDQFVNFVKCVAEEVRSEPRKEGIWLPISAGQSLK